MIDADQKQTKLRDALYKCAVGFTAEDKTEEYNIKDGREELVKVKITRRSVPPDLAAVKMLADFEKDETELLTEAELIKERDRLLELLSQSSLSE